MEINIVNFPSEDSLLTKEILPPVKNYRIEYAAFIYAQAQALSDLIVIRRKGNRISVHI